MSLSITQNAVMFMPTGIASNCVSNCCFAEDVATSTVDVNRITNLRERNKLFLVEMFVAKKT